MGEPRCEGERDGRAPLRGGEGCEGPLCEGERNEKVPLRGRLKRECPFCVVKS